MHITIIYAALFALFYLFLSFKVISIRKKVQAAIGDGGDIALGRAMRVHANFAEYVPLTLFLIYLLESQQVSSLFIHALYISLFVGRILHAYGVSKVKENLRFRVFGMMTNFSVIFISALYLLAIGVAEITFN